MIQEVLFFMVQYDVEAFMAACERKGLAAKRWAAMSRRAAVWAAPTIDGTLEEAHARKMNFVNLYG